MHKKIKFNQNGFTVLELMVVAAIMAMLLTMIIANFHGFEHRTTLDSEAEKIVSVIRQAQVWSLSGQTVGTDRYSYGVNFSVCTNNNCNFYLFKDQENGGNKVYDIGEAIDGGSYKMPAGVYIESVTPNSSNKLNVIFSAPLGQAYFNNSEANETASIVLKSTRFSGQKIIQINSISGQINIQ